MIPFIKSLAELMILTESRDHRVINYNDKHCIKVAEDSGQRKRYLRSNEDKNLELPGMRKTQRKEWRKGRKAISKFLDELDYNNQIQSSYDLTLLGRQTEYDHQDAA